MYLASSFKDEKGITLIETAIALIFFSFIIMTFLAITQRGLLLTADQQHRSNAVNLARQKLESLKSLDGGLDLRGSTKWNEVINNSTDSKSDETHVIGGKSYTVYTNYFNIPDTNINNDLNIIPINVTVEWNENGETMRISMDSIYYSDP